MKKRTVGYLIIYILLATITLTASIFAWTTLSRQSHTGGINSNIPNFSKMLSFQVKRSNDINYTLIKDINDMDTIFGNTSPGETYEFKINVINDLTRDLDISIYLPGFSSSIIDPNLGITGYSILDVFYMEHNIDKTITTSFYNKSDITNIDDFITEVPISVVESTGNSLPVDPTNVTKYGQLLNLYRLNNLISSNNTIDLIDVLVPENQAASISFKLVYDETTIDTSYQHFILSFQGIYIYSEQV